MLKKLGKKLPKVLCINVKPVAFSFPAPQSLLLFLPEACKHRAATLLAMKVEGGIQSKLVETFVKANKDKAWQGSGHRALFFFFYSVKLGLSLVLFNWAAQARTLFLFLLL